MLANGLDVAPSGQATTVQIHPMKIVNVHAQVEDDIDEWSQEDSNQQEVSEVVSYEEM